MEEMPSDSAKVGTWKSTKVWTFRLKVFETMLPPIAPCWEYQASGVRVDGQWCSLPVHGMCGTLDAKT